MTKRAELKHSDPRTARIYRKGREWKKGQSGNPKGKPPKIEGEIKKLLGKDNIRITKVDLARTIEILMSKSSEELRALATDKATPAYQAAIVTALGDSTAKGDFHKFRQIVEMIHGKPEQIITTRPARGILDPSLSNAEAMKQLQDFIKGK